MVARWSFQASHGGSSVDCTVEAPNAPVAMAAGVERAHEVFGCDQTLREAFEGDRISCQLSTLTGDLKVWRGSYGLSWADA